MLSSQLTIQDTSTQGVDFHFCCILLAHAHQVQQEVGDSKPDTPQRVLAIAGSPMGRKVNTSGVLLFGPHPAVVLACRLMLCVFPVLPLMPETENSCTPLPSSGMFCGMQSIR